MSDIPLTFRVSIFFARNPEEELTTEDVAVKFGVNSRDVSKYLLGYCKSNVLSRRRVKLDDQWPFMVYSAGPALKALIE